MGYQASYDRSIVVGCAALAHLRDRSEDEVQRYLKPLDGLDSHLGEVKVHRDRRCGADQMRANWADDRLRKVKLERIVLMRGEGGMSLRWMR